DWDKAFERFASLKHEQTLRPSGVNDKPAVESTINSLCSSLHSAATKGSDSEAATKGSDAVLEMMAKGSHYILGFRHVTFWSGVDDWKLTPPDDFKPSKEVLEQIASQLPRADIHPARFKMPEPFSNCSIGVILPGKGALVLGDFEKRLVISVARQRLAEKLIKHFISAYKHAIDVENTSERLDVRTQYGNIINSIIAALGAEVTNPRQAIERAADGLRGLGYRRVLICLVDPERQNIVGELDRSVDQAVDVARMTNWPLADPTADLQPYV